MKLYPKIDIYIGPDYLCSTMRARTLSEAVQRAEAAYKITGLSAVKADK